MMGEQVSGRESLRRALTIARHDSVCAYGSSCDDGLTTYPQISDLEVNAALAWFAEHRGPRVVSTVAEVESMPPGTVFRDRVWGSIIYRRDDDVAPIDTVVGGGYWIANGWEVLFTPTTESEDR